MAFYGSEFIFDGVPSSEYGLMIYSFGSEGQEDVSFQNGEIIEDRIPGRYDALTYGLVQNQALEYTLVFGANMESIDAERHIDRYEVETIAAWLTGHNRRKWLTIVQDDMEYYRYKCFISELKLITDGSMPWAFSCKVTCDSPFAYSLPEEYVYTVANETNLFILFNRSKFSGYYRPNMVITPQGGGTVSIVNQSDNNRTFQFTSLPGSEKEIYIDNKNQIISGSTGLNLYPYFNMKFMRLVHGDNKLSITGNATVKFICEFPVNIGG